MTTCRWTAGVAADDTAIDIDLRVLVFKYIRELLRNVVKHAGVRSATITVTRDAQELRAIVEDQGVGFEWQLEFIQTARARFRLMERRRSRPRGV